MGTQGFDTNEGQKTKFRSSSDRELFWELPSKGDKVFDWPLHMLTMFPMLQLFLEEVA